MSDATSYIIFGIVALFAFAVAYYYGRDEKPKL